MGSEGEGVLLVNSALGRVFEAWGCLGRAMWGFQGGRLAYLIEESPFSGSVQVHGIQGCI